MIQRTVSQIDAKYVLAVALIASAYAITAKMGLSLAFSVDQVTTFWPPVAIALITILGLGYKYWPAIFFGAFSANIMTNEPLLVAIGIAVGNTLAAVTGSYLLRRFNIDLGNLLSSIRNVSILILLGAILSTLVSSTIGTLSLSWGGLIESKQFLDTWRIWWVGDMMGILIFAPFFTAILNPKNLKIINKNILEFAVLMALVFLASVLIFTYGSGSNLLIRPRAYMIIPLLILAAFRFYQTGIFTAIAISLTTAVWGTVSGLGPFVIESTVEANLISLQIFFFVISATSLLGTVILSERNETSERLRTQASELEKTKLILTKELEKKEILEGQLKEANERATNILAGILDEETSRRSKIK